MADLLELQTNIPQVVALAYSDGKEFPSKIAGAPPQVMFTLVDGRRVFWPQPFAESLRNSGIAANVPFEVVKRETSKGKTQLQFRAVASTPTPAPPPPPAYVPAQTIERLYTARSEAPAAPVPQREPVTPASAKMCAAMCAAVDAALETQAYAARRGLDVEFSEESIRCIGLSIYISNEKGGR
jgi:hypothetical protein